MNLWHSLSGAVWVTLTSADPEQALAVINATGIDISRVQKRDRLTWRFLVQRRHLPALRSLVAKRGDGLMVTQKVGVYWDLRIFLRRPVLVGLLLVLTVATLYLPSRILFVQVEGNQQISENQIRSAAEACGIGFGASRRTIRSEKVKNVLLQQLPQLQWVGVNTVGCVATISVRERAVSEAEDIPIFVSHIVAARDGFLLSGTVVSGNALFQVGENVKKGQVLISGYTDCGICIQATRAQGEIMAQTNRKMTVVTPENYRYRRGEGAIKQHFSLLIGKKRINLWKDSGISDATCDRIYRENYVTLPGGFQLPIALCVDTVLSAPLETGTVSEPEGRKILTAGASRHLLGEMVAGSILDAREEIRAQNGIYRLTGSYVCTEMIGREQQEQIGEANGKNN